jgi:hypothetical protein
MTREFRALARATPGALLGGPFDPTLDPLLVPAGVATPRSSR